MCRNQNPCALMVGIYKGGVAVKKNTAVPQQNKNRITIWSSNSTFTYVPKRNESSVSKGHLHTHVLSSPIHNSEKVETTPMFIDKMKWIRKMCNTHTAEPYSNWRMGSWCLLQHGWTLRTRWQVKEASHKKTNTIWFHSCDTLRTTIHTESKRQKRER